MSEIKQEFDAIVSQLTGPGAPFEVCGGGDEPLYYKNAPANLVEAMAVARNHGDKEFLVYQDERRSFADVMAEADALAAALQAHGVRPGQRVACAMRNYPEWFSVFIAVTSIGAVIVPVNSWGQPSDIAYTVEDSGAQLVFCDQQRYAGCAEIFQEKGIEAVIARPQKDSDPLGFNAFIADFRGKQPAPVAIDADDLAMIMYTSGTSGKPKGAASTHRAISQALFNMECAAAAAAMSNPEKIGAMMAKGFEPTMLLAVPLFHVSGCHAQFLASLRRGSRIVMMYKWDVDTALQIIEKERVTSFNAAPSMALDLLDAPQFGQADTSSLSSVGIGGAATPPKVSKLIEEKVPNNFAGTGWGMTETNAQGASLTGKAFEFKPGSAGFPHPIVELRICDDDGEVLPAGETGEIWIRCVANIREYWHRPEANAEEFRDGWLKSGDIGYLDDDGFLFLADRAKDMIIRGGENIYPIEIENVLIEHDAIREVAAIGVPHERFGEEVAVIVHLNGTLSESELIDFARSRLAPYKVPTRVLFTDEPLPRNATNKVMKPVLRKLALQHFGLSA